MSSELMIEMKNVHKWFGELHVLNDINLEINKGEKIVICGPSKMDHKLQSFPLC